MSDFEATTAVQDYDFRNTGKSGGCGACCKGPSILSKIVVQSETEYQHMMADLMTKQSVVLKTVVLPKGVAMEDKRLRRAIEVGRKSYWLEAGKLPEMPIMPFFCDVEGALVPPCEGPEEGAESRLQVIPDALISEAEAEAEILVRHGVIQPEDSPAFAPPFLTMLQEATTPRSQKEGFEKETEITCSTRIPSGSRFMSGES